VYSELWSGKFAICLLNVVMSNGLPAQETLFNEQGKEREVNIDDVDNKEDGRHRPAAS
jgi:hypothetical protein